MRYGSVLFAVSILIAGALWGCSGSTGSKEPVARIGAEAPMFKVVSTAGSEISLSDFKGSPLVLTFMAEWCPCSNESAPVFKKAYTEYSPKGVKFMMLGFQDSRSKFSKFVERESFPFPAAYDKRDRIGISYGVNAPPTTFFIGADGKIKRAFYGKIDEIDTLTLWIDELLEGGDAPEGS